MASVGPQFLHYSSFCVGRLLSQEVEDVRPATHAQTFCDPFEGHGGLLPEPPGHGYFSAVSFAPGGQVSFPQTQALSFLLHDPLGFRHVPKGEADLTLSGHTHGGQVGLVSLGVDWTVLKRSRWPDQGLFGHGPNRLYVHRGTGFYGFPLRIGVPGETSVLEVVLPRQACGSTH